MQRRGKQAPHFRLRNGHHAAIGLPLALVRVARLASRRAQARNSNGNTSLSAALRTELNTANTSASLRAFWVATYDEAIRPFAGPQSPAILPLLMMYLDSRYTILHGYAWALRSGDSSRVSAKMRRRAMNVNQAALRPLLGDWRG